MTPHNEAKKEDIANIVLMPGDPLRAKYIAEKFLDNYKLVNRVRNMFAYTGYYKGKRITVMASGMGMPSMGIYCYELFKFYDVECIIRIGTCGIYDKDVKLLDTILLNSSYTEGNFAYSMTGEECHTASSSEKINNIIEEKSKQLGIKYRKANMTCTECFDLYTKDKHEYINRLPKEKNIIGAEMEAFALLYTANYFKKDAACLLSVVDSLYYKESVSAEARETALDNMIKIALETAISI